MLFIWRAWNCLMLINGEALLKHDLKARWECLVEGEVTAVALAIKEARA